MPAQRESPTPNIAPLFRTRMAWATRHAWPAGQQLIQSPVVAHSLWVVQSGSLRVSSRTREWTVCGGEMFLWPLGEAREIESLSCKGNDTASWITIGWHAELFNHLDVLKLLDAPRKFQPDQSEFTRYLEIVSLIEAAHPDATGVLLQDGLCRALTALLWTCLRDDDLLSAAHQTMPLWLQKSLNYAHAKKQITVSQMAREAGFSPAQFRRLFAHWMKASPREYLQHQKIEAVRVLLQNTDWPIARIAEECGFADATHLGKVWKKEFGVSPTLWKRVLGNTSEQI